MARPPPYRGFFWQSVLISVGALAHHHSHFAPLGFEPWCVSMEPYPALSAYRCTSSVPYQLRWPGRTLHVHHGCRLRLQSVIAFISLLCYNVLHAVHTASGQLSCTCRLLQVLQASASASSVPPPSSASVARLPIIIIIHCAPALAQAPWTLVTIILRPVAVG